MINYKFKNINLSCTNVIDVSALGKCHTLNLSCTNVSDLSQLGKCHTKSVGKVSFVASFLYKSD